MKNYKLGYLFKLLLPLLALAAFPCDAQTPANAAAPQDSSDLTFTDWQKRTVKEYPDIGVKGSEMNMKFVQKYNALRASNPAFFQDPKWPYLIAQQIAQQNSPSIIPGVEDSTHPYSAAEQKNNQQFTEADKSKLKLEIMTLEGQVKDLETQVDDAQVKIQAAKDAKIVLGGKLVSDRSAGHFHQIEELRDSAQDLQKKLDTTKTQLQNDEDKLSKM